MRSMKMISSQKGFTIIETLIVLFLVSLVTMAMLQLYLSFYASYAVQNASINASYSAGQIVNETSRLALQADAIIASHIFSGTTYTTGSTTIVLEIPSINSSGDIIAGKHDYAAVNFSTTIVTRALDADASSARVSGTKLLSDVAGNLTFTYNNGSPTLATNVTIDILTQSQVKQQTLKSHLIQKVYLRNL